MTLPQQLRSPGQDILQLRDFLNSKTHTAEEVLWPSGFVMFAVNLDPLGGQMQIGQHSCSILVWEVTKQKSCQALFCLSILSPF